MSLDTFEKLPEDKKNRILSAGIQAFAEKTYKEVSTDGITNACQISKGLLFHYFGSKKEYYLYCLEKSMERLTKKTEIPEGHDFYEILFASMNQKLSVCMEYPDEMHMVNMASRDPCAEIAREKLEVLQRYKTAIQAQSMDTLNTALAALSLKENRMPQITTEGLYLYINTILNKYLLRHQNAPDQFFQNQGHIQAEMKEYLNLMLYGICNTKEAL